MRKIIQITVAFATDDSPVDALYALCDDGSIWYCVIHFGAAPKFEWKGIPGPSLKAK